MIESNAGIQGIARISLLDELGNVKLEIVKKNLITTSGDKYYAQRGANGVGGNADAPTALTGMKLGTGTTAVAKASTGSALITYKTASNVAFTTTNSTPTAAVGSNVGWKITYTGSWGAGVATDSALTEAVMVNDSASNATSTEANTAARVVFTAVNKGANDTLVINWDHVFYDPLA